VLVHDQPFSILLFEDGCPAECRLLALARLLRHVRGHRGGDPVNVATFVNLRVVVDLTPLQYRRGPSIRCRKYRTAAHHRSASILAAPESSLVVD
jgi:hypothetical protein